MSARDRTPKASRQKGAKEPLPLAALLAQLDKASGAKPDEAPEIAAALIEYVTTGKVIAPRVRYNVACYFASLTKRETTPRDAAHAKASEDTNHPEAANARKDRRQEAAKRTLKHLRLALEGVYGDERAAYIEWAQSDPSLAPVREWEPDHKRVRAPDYGKRFEQLLEDFANPDALKPVGVEGLGALTEIAPEGAAKLKKAGITGWRGLLRLDKETADEAGIAEAERERWVALAELLEIVGIGIANTNLLDRAGIQTRAQLADAEPKGLAEQLRRFNDEAELIARPPNRKTLRKWISEARRLERQSRKHASTSPGPPTEE